MTTEQLAQIEKALDANDILIAQEALRIARDEIARLKALEKPAAFGWQCYQDRCENAYVEQSVVRRIEDEKAELHAFVLILQKALILSVKDPKGDATTDAVQKALAVTKNFSNRMLERFRDPAFAKLFNEVTPEEIRPLLAARKAQAENAELRAAVRKLRAALAAAKCRCIKSTKKQCPECGAELKWVGSGPGWMNSEQWDAVKAGDYYCLGTCFDSGTYTRRKYFTDAQLEYISQACGRCAVLADTAKWEEE